MLAVTPGSAALQAAAKDACQLLDHLAGNDEQHPVNATFVNSGYGLVFLWTLKGGLGVGVSKGDGFVLAYEGAGRWSAPCFLTTRTAHVGAIFGLGKVATLMAVTSPALVREIGDGAAPVLGSDLSMQIWPVVKGTQDVTQALQQAWNLTDLISVSSGSGAILDFSLKGGALRVNDARNAEVYGAGVSASSILKGDIPPPLELSAVYAKLREIGGIGL